jgi:hypothetical protein
MSYFFKIYFHKKSYPKKIFSTQQTDLGYSNSQMDPHLFTASGRATVALYIRRSEFPFRHGLVIVS